MISTYLDFFSNTAAGVHETSQLETSADGTMASLFILITFYDTWYKIEILLLVGKEEVLMVASGCWLSFV